MMNRRHGERGELEVDMRIENIYKQLNNFIGVADNQAENWAEARMEANWI
jgi:hypothetical protein